MYVKNLLGKFKPVVQARGTLRSRPFNALSATSTCVYSVASFPGLHRFFSSVCVQYNTQKRKSVKNGVGLGTPIT